MAASSTFEGSEAREAPACSIEYRLIGEFCLVSRVKENSSFLKRLLPNAADIEKHRAKFNWQNREAEYSVLWRKLFENFDIYREKCKVLFDFRKEMTMIFDYRREIVAHKYIKCLVHKYTKYTAKYIKNK